jgi:hypothetical protein
MTWNNLNTPKEPKRVSIDGYVRTPEQEKLLNEAFATLFATENGEKVLKYLSSITQDMVAGPNMDTNALWHLEGQRFLVGIIKTRSEKGKKHE